nr:hypothetical protein CFP56_58128 [Quercus suber]
MLPIYLVVWCSGYHVSFTRLVDLYVGKGREFDPRNDLFARVDPDFQKPAFVIASVYADKSWEWSQSLEIKFHASTCDPRKGKPKGSLEKAVDAKLDPWNARDVSDGKLPKAFVILFGDAEKHVGKVMLSRTETVRSQSCAQFVVSKESIHQHTREEYIALRQWLLDDGVAPNDDKISGRILLYLWHILFIKHGATGE